MYDLEKLYPKSFKKLAGWTLKNNFGFDNTPLSELKYTYYQYSDSWAFYWKNGNGRDLDLMRLFDFFESLKLEITVKEYRERNYENLFKRLELTLVEEDTSQRDADYILLHKHRGHVYKNLETGYKTCIYNLKQISEVVDNVKYEKVADKPHADGDVSYMCGSDYCRCSS